MDDVDVDADAEVDSVEELPPSAKLTAKMLLHHGPLNLPELTAHTLLPERTARWAAERLMAAGYVDRRPDTRDARKKVYKLAVTEPFETEVDGGG